MTTPSEKSTATSTFAISDDLDLPIDGATEAIAVVGRRGKGKSHTARRIAEGLIGAGVPVLAIDTVGVWWGLRSSADGESDGLPVVIFGGDHADVPLAPGTGAQIAEALVTSDHSAVLDVSHLDGADMQDWCAQFIRTVYRLSRTPRFVILDEADELIPQTPARNGTELATAVNHLVRRGRVRGLGVAMVSQRPALINKDVLSQASTFIVHGLTGLNDVKTITSTIAMRSAPNEVAEVTKSLPGMETGEAWVWSPEWLGFTRRIHVAPTWTFDSSSTPKVGQVALAPRRRAEIDLLGLGREIAAAVERDNENNVETLHATIADLRRELAGKTPAVAEPQVIEVPGPVQEVSVLLPADRDYLDNALATIAGLRDELLAQVNAATERVAEIEKRADPRTPTAPAAPRTPAPPKPAAAPARAEASTQAGGERVDKADRALLAALATHGPLDKKRLSFISGYSWKSSSFANSLGKMRRLGWIDGPNSDPSITESGISALGDYEPLPSGKALVDFWIYGDRVKLDKAAREFLRELVDVWPETLSNDDLADRTGYSTTSSSMANALGRLRSFGLATGDKTANRAADTLGEAAQSR